MFTAEKQSLPWWQKYTLTLEEASEYFGISYKKLRIICKSHADEDFILWNGNRALIKREQFEKYMDSQMNVIELEIKDISRDQLIRQFPQELRGLVSTIPANANKAVKIETVHTITEDGIQRQYNLPLAEESQGTRNLFLFSPVLKRAFETGEI